MDEPQVGLLACVLFTAAAVLARFVTLVPGALGVREFLVGGLALLTGFDLRDAVIASTIARAAEITVVFGLGGVFSWSLSRTARSEPSAGSELRCPGGPGGPGVSGGPGVAAPIFDSGQLRQRGRQAQRRAESMTMSDGRCRGWRLAIGGVRPGCGGSAWITSESKFDSTTFSPRPSRPLAGLAHQQAGLARGRRPPPGCFRRRSRRTPPLRAG